MTGLDNDAPVLSDQSVEQRPVAGDDRNNDAALEPPKQDEIEEWQQVSDLLDDNQMVNSTRLAESVIKASLYYENISRSEEAYSFINKQLRKIVSILLGRVDMGDANEDEKPIITNCLTIALAVVSYDLAKASRTASPSNSLQVLLDIFDEVAGFDGCNKRLISNFHKLDGFHNLGCYLSKLQGSPSFPTFNAINTVLQVVHANFKARIGQIRVIEETSNICFGVMSHLISLDDDKLAHVSDDAIDVCRLVQRIITDISKHDHQYLPQFFCSYREFILKLLKSSHLTSRVAGLEDLNNVLQNILKHRPPPRMYIVKGQTNQELNGVYRIDPCTTLASAWLGEYEDVVYIKIPSNEAQGSSDNQAKEGDTKLVFTHGVHQYRWKFQHCNVDIPKATRYRSSRLGFNFDGGLAIGFHILTGKNKLERDFVRWLIDNDIPGLMLEKDSGWAYRDTFYVRTSIERILEFALNSIPKSEEFEIGDSLTALDIERALQVSRSIMDYLLDDDIDSRVLGDMSATRAFTLLREIHKRAGDFDIGYMLDYHIFHRISVLKLMISDSSNNRKLALTMASRFELLYAPECCIVEGAGTQLVNGRYNLISSIPTEERYVEYTNDRGVRVSFESGRKIWMISSGDERYYMNNSSKNVPPKNGWAKRSSGIYPPPTLSYEGLLPDIPGLQSGHHDIADLLNKIDDLIEIGEMAADMHEDSEYIQIKNVLTRWLVSLDIKILDSVGAKRAECLFDILFKMYYRVDDSRNHSDSVKFLFPMATKNLSSSLQKIRDLGWILLSNACDISVQFRPPPQSCIVKAENDELHLSGSYEIDPSELTEDGWVMDEKQVKYVRQSPSNELVVLYRREIEVGDDMNIQWSFNRIDQTTDITSTDTGFSFSPVGQVPPPGEEHKTMEYELAKWAIKEQIIDKAFQDGSSDDAKEALMKVIELLTNLCINETGEHRPLTDLLTSAIKLQPSQKIDRAPIRRSSRKRKPIVQ